MARISRNWLYGLGAAVVLVFVVAVVLRLAGGQALIGAPTVRSPGASPAATLAYWTPQRMRGAGPFPMPVLQGGPRTGHTPRAGAPGSAGSAGGGPPRGEVPPVPSPAAAPGEVLSPNPAYRYPYPFARTGVFPFSQYRNWPWSANGRLFFTRGGVDYVCSGASVARSRVTKRRALVLTAGQCVNAGGTGSRGGVWSTNVIFCPAHLDGASPFGCWAGQLLWTTREWYASSNLTRDVGFVVVARNTCGELGDCVGDAGLAWNQSDRQQYWAIGYPQAPPFTGGRMILCTAGTAVRDAVNGLPGPDTVGIGCEMNAGSSGGAWNYGMRMGTAGVANSVTSYKYATQPLALYGPYFDLLIMRLWQDASASIR